MKKSIIAALVMMFALSACAGTTQRALQFDKGVLEPKADIAYDVAIGRICALPLDIQLRAVRRKTVTLSALIEMCPDWKDARDAMIGVEFNRLGIEYGGSR